MQYILKKNKNKEIVIILFCSSFLFGTDFSLEKNNLSSATPSLKIEHQTNKQIPAAIPVLTPEEAIKINSDAIDFQKSNKNISSTEGKSYIIANTLPVAIPVLTPEEAIKANNDAIRFQRRYKPIKVLLAIYHKIESSNFINFLISLLPLLLIVDIVFVKKKKNNSGRNMKYFSLSKRIRVLFSVSLLSFGLLVFVPWSVYFGNSPQFSFIFQDFVNWNLRTLTISIIGVSIVLLLLPPMFSDYLVAVIAGLGLCVYVQAMFMNQFLGTMNGIEPDWNEHRFWGIINMIIWAVIFLAPVILRVVVPSFFSKTISITTGCVLFLEIIATASMVLSASQNVWSRNDSFIADGSKQFQLSNKKNVVVFIFDTLGTGFVKECFDEYPETKDIVKDFIWYADARCNYTRTFPALSHELTGAIISVPANSYNEVFEKIWHSASAKSFYKQISDAGYDARLYCSTSEIGPINCFHEYYSNISARDVTYKIDYERIHSCLKQMAGYSLVPYLFKKHFFYAFDFSNNIVQKQVSYIPSEQLWIPNTNSDFFKKMTSSGIELNADKPVLSFYYLFGLHLPWQTDENCNKIDLTVLFRQQEVVSIFCPVLYNF